MAEGRRRWVMEARRGLVTAARKICTLRACGSSVLMAEGRRRWVMEARRGLVTAARKICTLRACGSSVLMAEGRREGNESSARVVTEARGASVVLVLPVLLATAPRPVTAAAGRCGSPGPGGGSRGD